MTRAESPPSLWRVWAWALVLSLAVMMCIYGVLSLVRYSWEWGVIWQWRGLILKGWGITIVIACGALVLSVVVALILMLGQRSRILPVQMLARGTTEFLRGTPLLVCLLLGYYGFANALRMDNALLVGMVILALFEGAYLAEIFRGALESIGATQWEAARAVGFSTRQQWRYVLIPQAVRRALPGTAGQMVSLVKDSSLLSVIGVEELTQMIRTANAQGSTALEGFLPLAVLYLVLTIPLSWWSRRLEERFRYDS